ncbi:hypothetical protein [Microbacterium sp. SORGH_AS_0969]|uniref:hypothetical protein n=1 Tax=Microbacterium sp. SORGH_AS_0969 TaxID=3041793 RepID=UPI0027D8D6B2|nr:hypothetical protein [Microbacterium sp. SORGH_AS_0969]
MTFAHSANVCGEAPAYTNRNTSIPIEPTTTRASPAHPNEYAAHTMGKIASRMTHGSTRVTSARMSVTATTSRAATAIMATGANRSHATSIASAVAETPTANPTIEMGITRIDGSTTRTTIAT